MLSSCFIGASLILTLQSMFPKIIAPCASTVLFRLTANMERLSEVLARPGVAVWKLQQIYMEAKVIETNFSRYIYVYIKISNPVDISCTSCYCTLERGCGKNYSHLEDGWVVKVWYDSQWSLQVKDQNLWKRNSSVIWQWCYRERCLPTIPALVGEVNKSATWQSFL